MPDLSEIRTRSDAQQVRWVLFIDGIAYAWTTDTGQGTAGSLLGSGAAAWIGLSETAIGGVEATGERTVLGGLELPPTIRESVDVKSGEIDPNPVVFKLHDVDGLLGRLFAREGKDYEILAARLAPGVAATAATTIGPGGTSVDLWGRNVNTERLGPAGERRMFPCIPYDLVGFDHAVHQSAPLPGELPPVLVSDEPLAWSGRMVTLYEVYRDPDSTATDASAWPTWDDQHAAGNLAWVGVVRGVSRQRGGVFELDCHGRDALLRRQLGTVSSPTWQPITAELNYDNGEDGIAVAFSSQGGAVPVAFNSSIFDRVLTEVTKLGLIDEIDGIINDVVDGTDVNVTPGGGVLDAWAVSAVNQDPDAGFDGDFWLRKNAQSSNQRVLHMWVAMHSRVWRQLGYEPETQRFDTRNLATEDGRQIYFRKLTFGEDLATPYPSGVTVPDSGYWLAQFSTVRVGYSETLEDGNEWDNNASPRRWVAKFQGEPFSIDLVNAGQIFRMKGGPSQYLEGQLTIAPSGSDVDGSAADQARIFALRGKVLRSTDGDPVDVIQVVLGEWNEGGTHGTVDIGASGVDPVFRTVSWLDPRVFGFNHRKLDDLEYWVGVGTGEGAIEAVALNTPAYFMSDTPEFAHSLLTQMLLSTGSGGGYSGGTITAGDNSPGALAGPLFFGDDLELADLGLAIPYQLVAPIAEFRDAFDTVPGGWASPLNRVRIAHVGPFAAMDVASSLMRPRRLMWRLHGGVFGVVSLGPFSPEDADLSILERDIYSIDPPDQLPAPVGHLDGIELSYRWDPSEKKTALTRFERSLDADAKSRTGELIEPIVDQGLMPIEWGVTSGVTGVPSWYEDFRQLWAFDAAAFYGLEHFTLVLEVSRPKGQDCAPGTRVTITNPWPYDSAGSQGITNHVGVLVGVDIDTATHARKVEAFVFGGQSQGLPFFAPMPRILDQAGAVLTVSTDQHEHGNANIFDAQGMTEPWWSEIGGAMVVRILYRIGEAFTLGGTFEVVSYAAGVLTLDGTPDTSVEYADRWLVPGNYDAQNANEYPRTLFGALVDDTTTHSTGPIAGRPFVP